MRRSVRTVPLFLVIALLAVMAGIPSAASAQTGGGPSVTMSLVSPTVQVRINSPLSVKAAFSEPVSGFSVDDIAVANGAAGNFTGSDGVAVYTFDVTPDAVGTVTVEIAAGAAENDDGNGNTAAPLFSLGIPYDDDSDGAISKREAIASIDDYLFGEQGAITRSQVLHLISLYLFGPPPGPGTAAPPGEPTGLMAAANGPTQIDLSWSPPSSDGGAAITGYRIEVSFDHSAWSDLVANTGSTSTTYSHTGLTAGTTRHYRVSAINSSGTGRASAIATGTTASSAPDRAALVALYNATDGANWTNNAGWLSDEPLDDWYGVTTDASGQVTRLVLNVNWLSGSIPAELGNLNNLTYLHLGGNQLSGEIPPELDNLADTLTQWQFAGNQFSGCVPEGLAAVQNSDLDSLGLEVCATQRLTLEDLPWVRDGITEDEMELIRDIRDLADSHPDVADSVITAPDETGEFIRAIMRSVRYVLGKDESQLEQLGSQSWFQDGLTEEEAALIVVLQSAADSEEVFDDLLQDGHVRSKTISLPLAGEVDLFAVGRSEFELKSALERMGFALGSMEGFMGIPWPEPDVIMLQELESDLARTAAGWKSGTHVVVKNESKNLTYHELAHFFFSEGIGPRWLVEGGADFLMLYTLTEDANSFSLGYVADQVSITEHCAPLGSASVQGWVETRAGNSYCPYWLGRQFLRGMYRILGYEVVSSALRELYENSRATDRRAIEIEDRIYQAFLSNTPSSQQDEFRVWYHCLHGRPIPGYTAAPKAAPAPAIRDALVALYNTTNGPGWKNSENWLSEAPLDLWHGVSRDCDGSLNRLGLYNNQLSGSIPEELGNLSNLTVLYLNNNQLTGSIPEELGNLSNLTVLYLNNNQLTGPIPEELGNLSNLTYLYLNNNQLTGPIPPELDNLSNLTYLYLNNNQLTGPIPPELGNLSNLTVLGLYNNQLSGSIPEELGNLSNLTVLDLRHNQLSGSIPEELGNLSNLERLSLIGNQLTGPIPEEMGNLSNLTVLDLHNNQLSGSIPEELGNLSNLTVLGLNNNQLTGPIPPELGNLSNLTYLGLRHNQLSGAIPGELGNLSNLTVLGLRHNQLSGAIPGELGNLSNLTVLYLNNNQLSGSIPEELGNLSNLTYLDLRHNQLSGSIPEELGNLSNLTVLYLDNNQLTGSIPEELGNLSNLTYLDLRHNQLSGSIPEELGNLSNLTVLYLDNNQLTGSIPEELGNLSNLTYLDLRHNQLSGSIPEELGNLSNLTYLYLRHNQLSGSIPEELGNLSNLERLFLSFNQLSGSIPEELGNLSNLTVLYLDNNQLTGSIPEELGNLSNLTVLDLRHNQLSGAIPGELGNLSNLTYLYLNNNQLTGSIPEELGNLSNLERLSLSFNQLSGCIPEGLRDVRSSDLSRLGLPFCGN